MPNETNDVGPRTALLLKVAERLDTGQLRTLVAVARQLQIEQEAGK